MIQPLNNSLLGPIRIRFSVGYLNLDLNLDLSVNNLNVIKSLFTMHIRGSAPLHSCSDMKRSQKKVLPFSHANFRARVKSIQDEDLKCLEFIRT